jgi:hypothetical protein
LEDQSGYELLNFVEKEAYEIGKQVQQFIFSQQLLELDEEVSGRRDHNGHDGCEVVFDGKDHLTFITRLGVIQVPVQQAHCKSHEEDFTPLNSKLPEHHGPTTTQSVQELSCLFAALSPSYNVGNQLLAIVLQEPNCCPRARANESFRCTGKPFVHSKSKKRNAY